MFSLASRHHKVIDSGTRFYVTGSAHGAEAMEMVPHGPSYPGFEPDHLGDCQEIIEFCEMQHGVDAIKLKMSLAYYFKLD